LEKEASVKNLLIILLAIISVGTVGYLSLGYDFHEALFITVIIMLSHFKHGVEDAAVEQILDVGLILGSYFVLAYTIKLIADYFFGGHYKENRRKKKMDKKTDKMKDHYIICGFGRVGSHVATEIYCDDVNFVILDRDQREVKNALEKGYVAMCVDPTVEDNLIKAGVERAKGLITCLGEDTDNLFVTLTARSLNPELYIVARANFEENISKFEKAGANRVATPYQIGGYHMATMALRPGVLDFLDVITDSRHKELEVEEIQIPKNSFMVGKSIIDTISRDKTGVSVLAVNRLDGTAKINPRGSEVVRSGDKLIIMGNRDQLDKVLEIIE
jgi:voltage-gated potassium channel